MEILNDRDMTVTDILNGVKNSCYADYVEWFTDKKDILPIDKLWSLIHRVDIIENPPLPDEEEDGWRLFEIAFRIDEKLLNIPAGQWIYENIMVLNFSTIENIKEQIENNFPNAKIRIIEMP